jgi:hypothetical protein
MTTPISPAPPAPSGPTPAKVKPSGWWVGVAIFLLLAGPAGCTGVFVSKSVSFINGYNRYASFQVPAEDQAVPLRQSVDRVGIFLRAANESGGAAVEDISVTSPSNRPVPLLTPQDSINAPVPSGGYLSVLRYFRVDETGDYHVTVTVGSDAQGAEMGIGKYDVNNLGSWLAGGFAAGGVLFLIGLMMLIIVLVRRSRSKREIRMAGIPPGSPYWGPAGSPPPGWGGAAQLPPTPYPPFPSPPQPSAPPPPPPTTPPGTWGAPPAPPPPPEQWAPAPWSAPSETASPTPTPPPPAAPPPPSPSPSPPSAVPGPPVSAPIPTVRPWQDAPKPSPETQPEDDDDSGAPDPPA